MASSHETGWGLVGDSRVGPQSRRLDSPGLAPGDAGVPAQPGPGEPEAGTEGLVFRVRPPRRAEPDGSAARDAVILSAGDLKIAREAVALARQDSENDKRLAEAAQPEPGPPAAEPPQSPAATQPPATQPPTAEPPEPQPQPTGSPSPEPQARNPSPAAPPPAGDRPTPSWGTVLATTVRLWAQRRLRGPRRLWPDSTRWRVISAVILAAVLFCGGAITVALSRGSADHQPASHQGTAGSGASAALAAAAAARSAAATWAAKQVAPAAIIACDPQMCSVLQRHGITASRLLPLGPGSPAPLGSDVIVSTAAVRQELGARLTSVYAPMALASFGAGSAQAVIRVVAPDGSAAYLRALRSDVAARAAGGAQLLHNPRIHVSPAARRALAAGQVDSRLLSTLAALATIYRVDVAGFGPAAAGAAPGMPLRSAELAPGPRITPQHPATVGALTAFLRAQLPPYRPARVTTLRLASGQTVLRVDYGAPEPLGLLGKS
jgi:hypothetical protein